MSYDPAMPWMQAKNTRAVLYQWQYCCTGDHLDVKQVGGGRFDKQR